MNGNILGLHTFVLYSALLELLYPDPESVGELKALTFSLVR
jgi:hypothetical protein